MHRPRTIMRRMSRQGVDRSIKPTTTSLRMAIALLACTACLAFVMALGTLVEPHHELAQRGAVQILGSFVSVFGLGSINIGAFLFAFAGIPWAVLHLVGLRSWWIAPLAGFAVAFFFAYTFTYKSGHPGPNTSVGTGAEAEIIDGRLTTLGESHYGTGAAAANGMMLGRAGAVFALFLWLVAYARRASDGGVRDGGVV